MSANKIDLAAAGKAAATEQFTQIQSGESEIVQAQRVSPLNIGLQPLPLVKYLELDSEVVKAEAAVDGSTAKVFHRGPGVSEVWRIDYIELLLASAADVEMTEFGNLAALTNGCLLSFYDFANTDVLVDLLDGYPLKSNNDIVAIADRVDIIEQAASWTLKARIGLGSPIHLSGGTTGTDEHIRLTVQDNLSTLTRFRATLHGALESTLT